MRIGIVNDLASAARGAAAGHRVVRLQHRLAGRGRRERCAATGEDRPDVVLMDLVMPVMDAWKHEADHGGEPVPDPAGDGERDGQLSAGLRAMATAGWTR